MCMVLLVVVQQLLDMLYTCYYKFLNYKFYLWINHWAIISCRTILQFGFGVDNQADLQIGPVELAAVGVSIAVFNQVSKIAIFPLVSVTTSFVAEEDATKSLSIEADDSGVLETGYAVNQEMELEDLIPKVGANFIFLPLVFVEIIFWNNFYLSNMPDVFLFPPM